MKKLNETLYLEVIFQPLLPFHGLRYILNAFKIFPTSVISLTMFNLSNKNKVGLTVRELLRDLNLASCLTALLLYGKLPKNPVYFSSSSLKSHNLLTYYLYQNEN